MLISILFIYVSVFISLNIFFGKPALAGWVTPDLKIKIPTVHLTQPVPCPNDSSKLCIPWLSQYISGIYNYAVGAAGILAAIALMLGGITWITAGGSSERMGSAKSWIGAGLTGLLLVLASYMILYQINPGLTNLGTIAIKQIKKIDLPAGGTNAVCQLRSYDPAAAGGGCGEGYTQVSYGLCAEQHWTDPEPTSVCCCPKFGGDWIFDPGIAVQIADASNELSIVLQCMRANMPQGVGRISSISDSNHMGSRLADCNSTDACRLTSTPCVHTCSSCHYGGGTSILKSYAVDYGDEENINAIRYAFDKCKSVGASYFLDEGDHIHISTRSCPRQ